VKAYWVAWVLVLGAVCTFPLGMTSYTTTGIVRLVGVQHLVNALSAPQADRLRELGRGKRGALGHQRL
jgi:hypothetical protein